MNTTTLLWRAKLRKEDIILCPLSSTARQGKIKVKVEGKVR